MACDYWHCICKRNVPHEDDGIVVDHNIYYLIVRGQVASTVTVEQSGYVVDMETCPAERRKGYAKAVLAELVKEHQQEYLYLICATPHVSLYTKAGFVGAEGTRWMIRPPTPH